MNNDGQRARERQEVCARSGCDWVRKKGRARNKSRLWRVSEGRPDWGIFLNTGGEGV